MFVVNTPAALAGFSEKRRARSFFPLFFIPHDIPLPANPGTLIIS